MNYNGQGFSDPKPELTIVNLNKNQIKMTDSLINLIAEKNRAEHSTNDALAAVMRANIKIIGNCLSELSSTVKLYNQLELF